MTYHALNAPKRIQLSEKIRRAPDMRHAGHDFKKIADAGDYPSPEAARRTITRPLSRTEGK